MQPTNITIDGQSVDLGMMPAQSVGRAVIISIFTWRRANPGDTLPGTEKMGWWGDTYPEVENDRIGSRLWLLSREKMTQTTLIKAREYVEEALQWLVEDRIAELVDVSVERQGIDEIVVSTIIKKPEESETNIRFITVWSGLT